jgi:hypothetical protein
MEKWWEVSQGLWSKSNMIEMCKDYPLDQKLMQQASCLIIFVNGQALNIKEPLEVSVLEE